MQTWLLAVFSFNTWNLTILNLWNIFLFFKVIYEISYAMQVNDSFPSSIALSWKGENGVEATTVVFPKGNPLPSLKVLTFYKASTFSVDVVDIDHPKEIISTYTVSTHHNKFCFSRILLKVLLKNLKFESKCLSCHYLLSMGIVPYKLRTLWS